MYDAVTSYLEQMERRGALSAKRSNNGRHGLAGWYPYYAGFSEEFVRELLSAVGDRNRLVMDPWNGAGTTTTVGAELGHNVLGFDMNPVPAVVASAKLVDHEEARHVGGILDDVVRRADAKWSTHSGESLADWLPPTGARYSSAMVAAILDLVAKDIAGTTINPLSCAVPPLAAFVLLGFLRAVRAVAKPLVGSNPTWLRPSFHGRVTRDAIGATFRERIRTMVDDLAGRHALDVSGSQERRIRIGDSRRLGIDDNSVDIVIASPPYCTRLDYVVNSRLELAALGLKPSSPSYAGMRRAMMGTPLVREKPIHEPNAEWGSAVVEILERIRRHTSSDSASYYYKTYRSYFGDLYRSLSEIRRALKPDGAAVIVVQTSYYKEIVVNLGQLCGSMASMAGFGCQRYFDVPVTKVLTTMNTKSRRHLGKRTYQETVVVLAK